MAEHVAAEPHQAGSAPLPDIQTDLLRSILAEVRAHRNDATLRENEAQHRHLNSVRLTEVQHQELILPVPSAAAGGAICPQREDGSPFPLLKTLHDVYRLRRGGLNAWLDHYGLLKLNNEREDRRTLFHFLTTAPGLEARKGRLCLPEEESEGL